MKISLFAYSWIFIKLIFGAKSETKQNLYTFLFLIHILGNSASHSWNDDAY